MDISSLLADRLQAQGPTLGDQLARARLPRRLRATAGLLARAGAHAAHPWLSRWIDRAAFDRAQANLSRDLASLPSGHVQRGRLLTIAATLAFNLRCLGAFLVAVLLWQGFV